MRNLGNEELRKRGTKGIWSSGLRNRKKVRRNGNRELGKQQYTKRRNKGRGKGSQKYGIEIREWKYSQ